MNIHRSRIRLPFNSDPRTDYLYRHRWRHSPRDEKFDRSWHLFCETCRSLARDGFEYTVKIEAPSLYEQLGDALYHPREPKLVPICTVEGCGVPKTRKASRPGFTLPPPLTSKQIKARMAKDPNADLDKVYWQEILRLIEAAEDLEQEAA